MKIEVITMDIEGYEYRQIYFQQKYNLTFEEWAEKVGNLPDIEENEQTIEDYDEWADVERQIAKYQKWEEKNREELTKLYRTYLTDTVLGDDGWDLTTTEDYWTWVKVEYDNPRETEGVVDPPDNKDRGIV